MSEDLMCAVDVINIVDSGINLSDHRPLVARLHIELPVTDIIATECRSEVNRPTYAWR